MPMVETLLVTGIHREELAFGDRVAALLDKQRIQLLRIPEGISHSRTGTDDLFYYNTRHREIYLQLRQQVKGHYRLLIDLHSGLNEAGRCADIYCRDEEILQCVAERSRQAGIGDQLRAVKILAQSDRDGPPIDCQDVNVGALTSIPKQIWNDRAFLYVGLEVYLEHEGVGAEEDWRLACDLIKNVQVCADGRLGD